jgi:SAM-dependent methyltransferase
MTDSLQGAQPYRELLIGCGRSRVKQYMAHPTHPRSWRHSRGPVTLDINRRVKPDIVCDLNGSPPWWGQAFGEGMPELLKSDSWDEIHAYQVLEHLGQQGDAHALLGQFQELWRLLRNGGYLVASVPSRSSPWLWGDPSHRRVIYPETLVFLDQSEYIRQCDGPHPTAMSDFRDIYSGDFRLIDQQDNRADFVFVLQAVKPSRIENCRPQEDL